jgi:hypothetical protein
MSGLLGWWLARRKATTYTVNTNTKEMRTDINVSNGIRTYDTIVLVGEYISCLRSFAHCNRAYTVWKTEDFIKTRNDADIILRCKVERR